MLSSRMIADRADRRKRKPREIFDTIAYCGATIRLRQVLILIVAAQRILLAGTTSGVFGHPYNTRLAFSSEPKQNFVLTSLSLVKSDSASETLNVSSAAFT